MEIWKDIVGFEGFYQVSNMGNIKSLQRIVKVTGQSDRKIKERILKLKFSSTTGYNVVCLYKNGNSIDKRVHRLVAESFLPCSDKTLDVNHINGIKTDNILTNLEWCTRSENLEHAYRTGLRKDSKFKSSEILSIRSSNESIRALSRRYSVDRNTIKQIKTRKTYKWVK